MRCIKRCYRLFVLSLIFIIIISSFPVFSVPLYGVMPAALTDTFEFQTSKGDYMSPRSMLRLGTSEYYIIVHNSNIGTSDGCVNSTKVDDDTGTIQKSSVDSLDFETGTASFPNLCHVFGDIYAVSYGSSSRVRTFSADDADGSIGATYIDTLTFTYLAYANNIIKVSGNMFVVAYANQTYTGGWLQSIYIDNSGNMPATWNDTVQFNTSARYMTLENVDSNTIALAYNGSDKDGYVCTFDVDTATGDISAKTDEWEFDNARGEYPCIKKISGNVFSIAYIDTSLDLQVFTFSISPTGIITKSMIDILEVDTGTDYNPVLFTVNNGSVYGVTFKDSTTAGIVKTFNMTATSIGDAIIDSLTFDATDSIYWAPIQWVNQSKYFIAWTGTGNDGWCGTFNITTNWATPTLSTPHPPNAETGTELTPQLSIVTADKNGDTTDLVWSSNSSGTWKNFDWNYTCANGTYYASFPNATAKSTKYYWRVNITDGLNSAYAIYSFTTLSNNAPTIAIVSPANGSTGLGWNPSCKVWVNDSDAGDKVSAKWYTNKTGTWTLIKTYNGNLTGNSLVNYTFTNFNTASTKYYWRVIANDSYGGLDNHTFHFTTKSNATATCCPTQSYNNTNYSLWWWIDLNVTCGTFNYTINASNGQNVSAFGVSNGTYGIYLYNLTLNKLYYIWVNLTGTKCWSNETYTVKIGGGSMWRIERDRFTLGLVIGGFSFLMMGMILWKRRKRRR